MNATDKMDADAWMIFSGSNSYHASNDVTLFSTSLPVLPAQKLNLKDAEQGHQTIHDVSSSLKKMHSPDWEANDAFEIDENHAIGSLLPDDEDELLAGIMDGFSLGAQLHHVDDVEDFDLFGSGGGLELESDSHENLTPGASSAGPSDGGNGMAHFGPTNGMGTVAGEHPLGEHPSRTLFVRNINSNVEDSELRSLFEPYGAIRSMYTACKHRGFVMISYYDIRAARNAKRLLQNKLLGRRKLDIHFSIPKDNPSDKDLNQGTLVVFNLDPSVSNDDLKLIFGAYGQVKEIRETPHKKHHKFVEYYDIRDAEDALRSLNRSDIAGKRIKLEPSRPGGARRNLMLHTSQDSEQDEPRRFRHQVRSSIGNSPPGNWTQLGSPVECGPLQSLSRSPSFRSPTTSNNLYGLASILDPQISNSPRVAPVGKDSLNSLMYPIFTNRNPNREEAFLQSLSFPEQNSNLYSGTASSFDASSSNGSVFETLSGSQFLWRSPKLYSDPGNFPIPRGGFVEHHFTTNGQNHGFTFANHGPLFGSSHGHHQDHHHSGSAPSGFPFQRHFGYCQEPPGTLIKTSFDGLGYTHNDKNSMVNLRGCGSVSISGNLSESGSPGFGLLPSLGFRPLVLGNGHFSGNDVDTIGNQMDNTNQFQLDLHKIGSGEDTRSTLMIKNIPNKYTSKMLLAAIDENHRGTYDFLYLPIDFKNKCNVGYAFINMLSPSCIIPFYVEFNGKRWEKFNSEKLASLAYARIQGKAALVSHFQNSSLMNEDKRCWPIVLNSGSSGSANNQEQLHSNMLHTQVWGSYSLEPRESVEISAENAGYARS